MSVIKITSENFNDVINSNKPVLIDAYATWCGPCKMQSPIVDEVSEELGESAIVGKVDVDEEGSIAQMFSIMSIPTLLVFKDGKLKETFVGLTPKKTLLDALK